MIRLKCLIIAWVVPMAVCGVELRELSRRPIRESEYPMNFCHAKDFPDGTIYLGHTIGTHMRGERGATLFSPDAGRTWTTNGPFIGGMNAFLTRDGRKRFVTGWDLAERQIQHPIVTTIGKDGSVTNVLGSIVFPKPVGMCLYRDVVRLSGGALLLCGYTRDDEVPTHRKGMTKGTTSYVLKSDDEGLTWKWLSFIPPCANAQEGQGECSVVERKDGTLVLFVRTGNAMYPDQPGERGLRRYISLDGGATWDAGKRIADYGVEPQAGILSDGTLFILSGRPGVYLLLDPTGTGDHFKRFDIFKGMGSSSSTLMELQPGKLSIIYDDSQYSLWKCDNPTNRIMLVEYDYKAK